MTNIIRNDKVLARVLHYTAFMINTKIFEIKTLSFLISDHFIISDNAGLQDQQNVKNKLRPCSQTLVEVYF